MCRVFLVLSSKPESFQLRGSLNRVMFCGTPELKIFLAALEEK